MSFDDLAASLRGELVTRESTNYDEVRAIYNAMIDKKPAALPAALTQPMFRRVSTMREITA